MRRSCVLLQVKISISLCINLLFYTRLNDLLMNLRTKPGYIQTFEPLTRSLIHIKFLKNPSVNYCLSTLSTQPITKTTNLKLNKLIIYKSGSL